MGLSHCVQESRPPLLPLPHFIPERLCFSLLYLPGPYKIPFEDGEWRSVSLKSPN